MTGLSLSAPPLQSELKLQVRQHFATWLGVLFVVIALTSSARPQEPSPAQSHPGDEYTIRVDVDVVVLHATAQDRKNILVSGLDKDDFQVYEDGALQPIRYFSHEDIPITVGLVVDNSGSMGPKRRDVVAAALAFARSSNPQDQMFVVNFNEKFRSVFRAMSRSQTRWGSCKLLCPGSRRMVRRRYTTHCRRSRAPEKGRSGQEGADRGQRWRRQRQQA